MQCLFLGSVEDSFHHHKAYRKMTHPSDPSHKSPALSPIHKRKDGAAQKPYWLEGSKTRVASHDHGKVVAPLAKPEVRAETTKQSTSFDFAWIHIKLYLIFGFHILF